MRSGASFVLAVLAFGCQPRTGAELPERLDALAVTSVCLNDNDQSATVAWPAIRWPGALFSASQLDGAYVATVKIGHTEIACDHCPGPPVAAVIAHSVPSRAPACDRSSPPGCSCLVGVGPVDHPLTHLRITDLGPSPKQRQVSDWQPRFALDLDGQGGPELEQVQRCARVDSSGCNDHVCTQICTGVRSVAQPRDVRFVECQSFIPDSEDCPPG